MGFFTPAQSYLGIDIGSTSIKLVELKKEGKIIRLLTYGFSEQDNSGQTDWQNNCAAAADIINKLRDEAGAGGNSAVSALPTFSVFSSVLNLSNVSKKDISAAVHWEAKKVIPLPLEDMILDWKQINEEKDKKGNKQNTRVLLTGAPRTLVKKYIEIFKEAKLNLLSLETETFSLIRSLVGNDKSTVMIVEFGASTTDVSIIDKGIPMLNRSIDVGGITITKALSRHAGIDDEKAEQLKYDLGISRFKEQDGEIPRLVSDTIAPVVNEIKYAINLFQNKNNKKTEKVILSGGSALLPDLVKYLGKILDMKVIIGDSWARVSYPEELRPLLQEIGPRMSVAIGLALRELE